MSISAEEFKKVTEQQRLDDAISSYTTKRDDLRSQIEDLEDSSPREKFEGIQKGLGMAGQALGGLAMGQKMQEAIKPISMIAQMYMGISALTLSSAFGESTRDKKLERANEALEKAQKTLDELKGVGKTSDNSNSEPGSEESKADAIKGPALVATKASGPLAPAAA